MSQRGNGNEKKIKFIILRIFFNRMSIIINTNKPINAFISNLFKHIGFQIKLSVKSYQKSTHNRFDAVPQKLDTF